MREPAVIVAGGGPAGSAVARLLSLWGHSVLLLTRPSTRPPFAESLPPSCRKLLDPLGVIPRIDAAGFVRTTGNTVWWGGTEARRHNFGGDEPGYQVRRDVLDQLLLEAAEAAGVEVRRNAAVREIRPPDSPMEPPRPDTQLESGGGPQAGPAEMTLAQAAMTVTGQAGEPARPVGTPAVRFDSDGQSHTLHAPWIVDATGQTGVLARRSWRRAGHAPRTLALVAAWDRHDSWDLDDATHTLVESYESGWAWSVPVTPTTRHFAVMIDPQRTPVDGREALERAYRQELGRTLRFRVLLQAAQLGEGPWATDASPYDFVRAAAPGLLLAGDAASFIDPLSSYGVKKALASAWLAAVVINTCLRDVSMEAPALEFYEAREREMYESLTQQSADLAGEAGDAHAHPFWRDRAAPRSHPDGGEPDIAALRSDPDVLAAFSTIREAPSLRLRESAGLERAAKPVVRENRLVLMPHLVAPAFPAGIRYLRGIDVAILVELAGRHDQVPDLYDAYQRTAAPVALPDFLGALSVVVGKGLMRQA